MDDTAAAPARSLRLRLSIPVEQAFVELGASLAARFARVAGFSEDQAAGVGADVARAAGQVSGRSGSGASLDFELSHDRAAGLEISVRRDGGDAEVVRLAAQS